MMKKEDNELSVIGIAVVWKAMWGYYLIEKDTGTVDKGSSIDIYGTEVEYMHGEDVDMGIYIRYI